MRHEDRIKARLMPRIESWRKAFSDKTTGIHRTLDDLIYQYACFRVVIRIVDIANHKRDPDHPPLNQMIFDMIADGYWSHLLLGARRLLDPQAISGKVGVYSLRSVLADIKACAPKITRRIYVEAIWDADYDLPALEAARSRMAHEYFDFLSNTSAENRSGDDLLNVSMLKKIEARLAKLDSIKDHVTVHLAHSGNKTSREGKLLENFGMSKARECLKELKEVADFIGGRFCQASGSGLTHFTGDQFEGLDRPMIETDSIPELEAVWREIDQDVSTWHLDRSQL